MSNDIDLNKGSLHLDVERTIQSFIPIIWRVTGQAHSAKVQLEAENK